MERLIDTVVEIIQGLPPEVIVDKLRDISYFIQCASQHKKAENPLRELV